MQKVEIEEREVVVLLCDVCLKKCFGAEYYSYKFNLRTPNDTHFHVHHNCLMNLIRDNKGAYQNKEVFKV